MDPGCYVLVFRCLSGRCRGYCLVKILSLPTKGRARFPAHWLDRARDSLWPVAHEQSGPKQRPELHCVLAMRRLCLGGCFPRCVNLNKTHGEHTEPNLLPGARPAACPHSLSLGQRKLLRPTCELDHDCLWLPITAYDWGGSLHNIMVAIIVMY